MAKLASEGCTCGELSNMMAAGDIEGYMLKPMNCPHHIKIYASQARSTRFPLRLAEFGTVYRWEQSGEISGLQGLEDLHKTMHTYSLLKTKSQKKSRAI